jgi:hypothetical protein
VKIQDDGAVAVNACSAVQRKICTSIMTFHFRKAEAAWTSANVRLLCAKCNLLATPSSPSGGGQKSDKILTTVPWIFAGAAAAPHIQRL